jgi:hypothetical protein
VFSISGKKIFGGRVRNGIVEVAESGRAAKKVLIVKITSE